MERRLPRDLALACAIYVALRLALLYTAFDELAMPAYELYPMGTIPRVLLGGGGGLPLSYYYDNAAGQLVTGLLATPFYAFFGPTWLALKMVPFLLGLATLVLAWHLARAAFGPRAGAVAALALALGPTTLAKYSLMASGNHFENLFFTLLAVALFWRLHAEGATRGRLALFAFACGLALFVFLGALIPVALLALFHLGLRGWRRTARDLAVAGPAFALGVLPLLLLNLGTSGRGMGFLEAKFGDGVSAFDPARFGRRALDFFALHLPRSATFPDFLGMPGELAGAVFLACFLLAWALFLPAALRSLLELARGALGRGAARATPSEEPGATARPPLAPTPLHRALIALLVLYLPLTAVAFGLSNFVVGNHPPPIEAAGYRYFLPHMLFAILLAAFAAARLRRARIGWVRGAGSLLGAALVAVGLFDLALVDPDAPAKGLGSHYDGYNVKQSSKALIAPAHGLAPREVAEHAESFRPVFRERVWHGVGYSTAFLRSATGGGIASLELALLIEPWPAERRAEVARGVGTFLRWREAAPGVLREEARALLEGWSAAGEPYADSVFEGLASEWSFTLHYRVRALLESDLRLLESLPEPQRPPFARGLGADCGRFLRRGIPAEELLVAATIGRLPPPLARPFFTGLGAGLADGAEEPALPPSIDRLVPERFAGELMDGFRARTSEIWGAGALPDTLARARAALPPRWQRRIDALAAPPVPGG